MTYDAKYWDDMRRNNGVPPKRVSSTRFWELLEVLFPANWSRRLDSESFMVPECQTGNLYTWCARLGRHDDDSATYWEMIAPDDCTHQDILRHIAMQIDREERAAAETAKE